jgi:mannosyltransferase OCH1-like enzyme
MIPKKIHYCWISGNPYPALIQSCIDSWQKNLPDYEFVLWDAERVKAISCDWFDGAMEAKKYGSISDYVRLHALYHEGGIYLDADVEVLKNFDDLLSLKSFIGLEQSGDIEAAIIGTESQANWVGYALRRFQETPFWNEKGVMNLQPLPVALNQIFSDYFHCKKVDFAHLKSDEVRIFPQTYFSPKNLHTNQIKITSNTYTIHHFDGSWINKSFTYRAKLFFHKILILLFGQRGHNTIIRNLRRFL